MLRLSTALIVASIITLSRCRIGSCPPALPVDVCEAQCDETTPCNSTKMCCPTACGGAMCVKPVTKRLFVDLVKDGRCPEPHGVWVCTYMCSGDSDCPRKLKCCPNRCGALACQLPDFETAPPTDAAPPPDSGNNY